MDYEALTLNRNKGTPYRGYEQNIGKFYNFPLKALKCTLYGDSLILFYLYCFRETVMSLRPETPLA